MHKFSTNTKEDYDASFIKPNENIQTGELIVISRNTQYHKGLMQEIVVFRIGSSKLKKILLSYLIGAAAESPFLLTIFKNPQDEKSEIIDGLWANVIDGELKIIKSTYFPSNLNVEEGTFIECGRSYVKNPKDINNKIEIVQFWIGGCSRVFTAPLEFIKICHEKSKCCLKLWQPERIPGRKEFNPKLPAKIVNGNLTFLN